MSGRATWTEARCLLALQRFPADLFRMNDAFEYCGSSFVWDVTKADGQALWVALQRHGFIERSETRIGKWANRWYWRRTLKTLASTLTA